MLATDPAVSAVLPAQLAASPNSMDSGTYALSLKPEASFPRRSLNPHSPDDTVIRCGSVAIQI